MLAAEAAREAAEREGAGRQAALREAAERAEREAASLLAGSVDGSVELLRVPGRAGLPGRALGRASRRGTVRVWVDHASGAQGALAAGDWVVA